jgi:hypothetical protein
MIDGKMDRYKDGDKESEIACLGDSLSCCRLLTFLSCGLLTDGTVMLKIL